MILLPTQVDPIMMGALMSACSLINAGAGTEEVSQQLKILENKFLAITKFQTIASPLDFSPRCFAQTGAVVKTSSERFPYDYDDFKTCILHKK